MLDKFDFRKFRNSGKFIIWVIGGPGSGKTALCAKLSECFSYIHISISELLSNLVASDSSKAKDDFTTLKKSQVIPSAIVLFLIKQELATRDSKGFLIDGFPIDISQGQKFEEEIAPVDCILFLKTDENTMIERIYYRSKMAKGTPEKISIVSNKIKAFREFKRDVFLNYSSKIEIIDANMDFDTVQRKAAMKMNNLIIKHFTMKILKTNHLMNLN